MQEKNKIHLFIQDNLAFKAISKELPNQLVKIKKFKNIPEKELNENLNAIFIIDSKFFAKNRLLIRQLTVSLVNYSIIFVFEKDKINEITKEKENFFSTFVSQEDFPFLINKLLKQEIKKISLFLNQQKKILDSDNFKNEVLKIGVKMGNEKDANKLLNEILFQSMKLVKADAGSIAVLGLNKDLKRTDKNILTFYASKNISKEIHFNRFSLKVSNQSLAGYTILNQEILNINDVYKIKEKEVNYAFNKEFDKRTKFRTKSILVIPMINQKNQIMGVIQLINKKEKFEQIIDYNETDSINKIVSFNNKDIENLKSLSSFLTVPLENAILYNEIDELFNSFVQASVSAVEQRDPSTSGHSFRVASYTINLAHACNKAGGLLENYNFNYQQIRELRYAALLHDFGKIGVRENVLIKSKKLYDSELKDIFNRINLYIYHLKFSAEKKKKDILIKNQLSHSELKKVMYKIDLETEKKIKEFQNKKKVILEANIPSIMEKKTSSMLKKFTSLKMNTDLGKFDLITPKEFTLLSIQKGNLSNIERKEIEFHVTHTFNFLKKIPWTKDLSSVPDIAYGHHEKLDGSGYPLKKSSNEILPQTKIMTICDIFDALTASDRPYKKSIDTNQAIEILYLEANKNKLDKNLVDYFIRSNSYKIKK